MNIPELAKKYAEKNTLHIIETAISQAYADGFVEGYNKCLTEKNNKHLNHMINGMEYVDLGLPSGTLWSLTQLKDHEEDNWLLFTYEEAASLNIPTKEQYEELLNYCQRYVLKPGSVKRGTEFLGRNGNIIRIYDVLVIKGETKQDSQASFWLKDETVNERGIVRIAKLGETGIVYANAFAGMKLPVMLVK